MELNWNENPSFNKAGEIQEDLEKKKAEYGEKMKNKVALIHKEAEEKKATVEAQRSEELLKAEETAAKFRATGTIPKKFLGCFWWEVSLNLLRSFCVVIVDVTYVCLFI